MRWITHTTVQAWAIKSHLPPAGEAPLEACTTHADVYVKPNTPRRTVNECMSALQNGRRKYVLRKKPPGKVLASAHAVEREYQVRPSRQRSVGVSKEQLCNHGLLAWILNIMHRPHAGCMLLRNVLKSALARSRGSAGAGTKGLSHPCRCLRHCATQTFQCPGRCALPRMRPSLAHPSMSWSTCRSALNSLCWKKYSLELPDQQVSQLATISLSMTRLQLPPQYPGKEYVESSQHKSRYLRLEEQVSGRASLIWSGSPYRLHSHARNSGIACCMTHMCVPCRGASSLTPAARSCARPSGGGCTRPSLPPSPPCTLSGQQTLACSAMGEPAAMPSARYTHLVSARHLYHLRPFGPVTQRCRQASDMPWASCSVFIAVPAPAEIGIGGACACEGLALGAAVPDAAAGGAHAGDGVPDCLAAEPHTGRGRRPDSHPHLPRRLQVRCNESASPGM